MLSRNSVNGIAQGGSGAIAIRKHPISWVCAFLLTVLEFERQLRAYAARLLSTKEAESSQHPELAVSTRSTATKIRIAMYE